MRIAILDDYPGAATRLADWSGLGEVTVFRDTLADEDAVVSRLQPFDILCLMRERTPLPRRVIDRLPNLRFIVTTGLRNLSIDLDAAKARGIPVSGTDLRAHTTPELAMGLIIALNRAIIPEAASLAAGGWQRGLGRDLHGLTLGIVGLGRLGGRMAELGKAFGMEVVAWSQNLNDERCAPLGITRCDSLAALMAASDVVTIHLVLSDRTRGLIGADALAAMRPGAYLVNTSRGPIVDSMALLDGLRRGFPHGAALDVYDMEPLPPDHALLGDRSLIESGRLLLTPHLGYATEQTFRLAYGQAVEAIRAWHLGSPIRLLSA